MRMQLPLSVQVTVQSQVKSGPLPLFMQDAPYWLMCVSRAKTSPSWRTHPEHTVDSKQLHTNLVMCECHSENGY